MVNSVCENVCMFAFELLSKDHNTVIIATDNQALTIPMTALSSRALNSQTSAEFNAAFIMFNPLQLLGKDLPLVKTVFDRYLEAAQKANVTREKSRILLHFRLPKGFRKDSIKELVERINSFTSSVIEQEAMKPAFVIVMDTPSTEFTMELKSQLSGSIFNVMADHDDHGHPTPSLELHLSNYLFKGERQSSIKPFPLYRMKIK